MDYRRAGLSRQLEQRRRRPVRSSWSWLWQLRSRAELLRPGPVLRRSRGLLHAGSGRAELLRSRRCSDLLRSGCGSGLLRSRADLLHEQLQQLLQTQEVQEELVRRHEGLQARRLQEEQVLQDQLLRSRADLLRSGRSDLLRPGCSQLLRSGRRADLCRSDRVLLPLVFNREQPGVS